MKKSNEFTDKERLDYLESLNVVVAGCDDVAGGCFLSETTIWKAEGDDESLRELIDEAIAKDYKDK